MTLRSTYVCEDCHAGWQVDDVGLNVHNVLVASTCRWCGRQGKLRGVYRVVALPHSSHALPSLPREGQEHGDTGPDHLG